ncbi:MAG: MFS transporter [Bifidobacteriaceae bacterium]|jgi:MFS family permease|nr:MFS transporter [Bifidobacteriaceae bacterium]
MNNRVGKARAVKTAGEFPGARRAALSALFGSTVEYYDFTLYATASALFLGQVFFKPLGPTAATIASFVTFGLAFVARPAGAIAFGHLGDRIGRRPALVGSVTLMGASTFAIGLLPGYGTWGVAAPALLVLLRLAQGFSAGAEQAGSNALALENAPEGQRARYAAWTMQGTAMGTLFGKLAFIAIVGMPDDVLLSWGWRLPFLAAGPLLLAAVWIRSRAQDAPVFEAQRAAGPARAPLAEVLRHHWLPVALVAGGTLLMMGGAALNVFGLNVATKVGGMAERDFLVILAIATGLELVFQPLWARLADRIGRRPVLVGTLVAEAALFFFYLPALISGNAAPIAATALAMAAAWSGANAVSASFFSEQFPTRVRYTGAAFGSQLGMILVGFTPTIMMGYMGKGGATWPHAAVFAAACMIVAAACCLATRETHRATMSDLDAPRA